MPRLAKPLSDTQIRRAEAGTKPLKLYDGYGLYLEGLPIGSRFCRFRYRQANGKESSITFGPYPELSLADARLQRSEARRFLLDGTDPGRHRDEARRQTAKALAQTFRQLALNGTH